MSSLNYIATARSEKFSGRVLMLSFTVGQQVATEDPATADHAARMAYAERIFRGAEQAKLIAAHVIASNPTIKSAIDSDPTGYGDNVSDADIQFALSSIWTSRALAFADAPA